MKRLITVIIAILILCYPLAVYFGLQHFSPRYLALGIAFVFLLRFILFSSTATKRSRVTLILITTAGVIISIIGIISNATLIIKLYPCVINLLLFSIFLYSILHPPTIITRLAQIKTSNLPPKIIKYTKNVAVIWCVFFIINGFIALWTALFASTKIWTFYNGFLAYIIMGTLFITEFLYRQWVKAKHKDDK